MVINYLLNDDNVVCTLQDAELYTPARLSTVVADFARTAAKHMNGRAASKPAHLNPSPPPLTTSAFTSDKYIFLSPRRTFFFPLTKQAAAPPMETRFCWPLKWNPLSGTLHAGNGLPGNKTATYVPVCEAKCTPNISKTFPGCRCNPVYSKFTLNHNPSPVPFSP